MDKDSSPYQRFIGAISEPETKVFYEGVFGMFYVFWKAESVSDLLPPDNIMIEDKIMHWITQLKMQVRATTIASRVEVLKLFYDMNRRPLSWKMIERLIPKLESLKHRGWWREEIQRMMPVAKIREQAVILFFASSLCRRGSLEWKDGQGSKHFLKIKHLIPRDEFHIFEGVIYEGAFEEYHCYTTPEARAKLEEYWDLRRRYGEAITPESYVFIQEWNTRDPKALENPQPATIRSIEDAVDRVVQSAGLRKKVKVGKTAPRSAAGKVRHEQKLLHGFRAFGETTLLDAGMSETWVDMIEGHKLKGFRENYYRPRDDTVLVGTTTADGKKKMWGYLELMPELIINNEERAKYEVASLKNKLKIEYENAEAIKELRTLVGQNKKLVES